MIGLQEATPWAVSPLARFRYVPELLANRNVALTLRFAVR